MEELAVLLIFIGFSESYVAKELMVQLNSNIARSFEKAAMKPNAKYGTLKISSICIVPGVNNQIGFALVDCLPIMARFDSGEKPDFVTYNSFYKMIVVNEGNAEAKEFAFKLLAYASKSKMKSNFFPKFVYYTEPE